MLEKRKKLVCLYIFLVFFLFLISLIPMYYHNYNLFYDIRQVSDQTMRYSELKDRYYYVLYEDPDGKFSDMLNFLDHSDFIPMNKKDASSVLDNLTQNQAEYIYLPCAYYGEETDKSVPANITIIKEKNKTYGLFKLMKTDNLHMFYNFYEIAGDDGYTVSTDFDWRKLEENFSQTVNDKTINCIKSYIQTFRWIIIPVAAVLIIGGSVLIIKADSFKRKKNKKI